MKRGKFIERIRRFEYRGMRRHRLTRFALRLSSVFLESLELYLCLFVLTHTFGRGEQATVFFLDCCMWQKVRCDVLVWSQIYVRVDTACFWVFVWQVFSWFLKLWKHIVKTLFGAEIDCRARWVRTHGGFTLLSILKRTHSIKYILLEPLSNLSLHGFLPRKRLLRSSLFLDGLLLPHDLVPLVEIFIFFLAIPLFKSGLSPESRLFSKQLWWPFFWFFLPFVCSRRFLSVFTLGIRFPFAWQ